MATYDLGFLGGGQLARMSIQAAQRMGLRCLSLDPAADSPASQVSAAIQGSLDDPTAIAEVMSRCERITFENEFVPAPMIREACHLSGRKLDIVIPDIEALGRIQDKLWQRKTLDAKGVPSPRAIEIDPDDPAAAIEAIGFPMVLKVRFGGYDGKGTRYARDRNEIEAYRDLWETRDWMAEEFVPFRRELAVMIGKGQGTRCAFPVMETVQRGHVCDVTFPARLGEFGEANIGDIADRAVDALGGDGLFGVELFELEDGRVLVNEIAPRPHNTGHYSLDWDAPSQFEVHVRAAMGMAVPLELEGADVAMVNLFGQANAGDFRPALAAIYGRYPGIRFHWYGKAESKPGRKMGHLNGVIESGRDADDVVTELLEAREFFYQTWTSMRQTDHPD